MTGNEVMNVLKNELPFLQKDYGVEYIGLFGSYAKGTQTAESDMDFLVAVKPPLAKNYFGLWDYLEKKFNKKIDLVMEGEHLREKFLKTITKEIIYA